MKIIALLVASALVVGCRQPPREVARTAPEPAASASSVPDAAIASLPPEELLFSWKAAALRDFAIANDDVLLLRGPYDGEDELSAVGRSAPHAVVSLGKCAHGGAEIAADLAHVALGCSGTPKTKIGDGYVPREADGTLDLFALTPGHHGERTRLLADVATTRWIGLEFPYVALLEPHALSRIDTRTSAFTREKLGGGALGLTRQVVLQGSSAWMLEGLDLTRLDAGKTSTFRFAEMTDLFGAFTDGSALIALRKKLGAVATSGVLEGERVVDLGSEVRGATIAGDILFAITRQELWCGVVTAKVKDVKKAKNLDVTFESIAVDARDVIVVMTRAGVNEVWRYDRRTLGCASSF